MLEVTNGIWQSFPFTTQSLSCVQKAAITCSRSLINRHICTFIKTRYFNFHSGWDDIQIFWSLNWTKIPDIYFIFQSGQEFVGFDVLVPFCLIANPGGSPRSQPVWASQKEKRHSNQTAGSRGTVPPLKGEVAQVLLVKPDLPRCWDPTPSLSQGFTPCLGYRHTVLLILGGPRLLQVGELQQPELGWVDGLCQAERCFCTQGYLQE